MDPDAPFWSQKAPSRFRAKIETTRGAFVIEAHRDWAPIGVDRFYNLVRAGFYDDSRFYRVRPRWAQFGIAGDPAVSAIWRDRRMPDDPVVASNLRGTIAYAMTGPNARTTQVYISLIDRADQDTLGFTVFGKVISGMSVVDSLYAEYGETSGGGMRAGKQAPLFEGGNAYLDKNYPKLDHLIRATIVPEGP
jgi:homoserine O-acetyltransferase